MVVVWLLAAGAVPEFVDDLEFCITNHARRLAETFPQWGNKCNPVTSKVDFQAALYEETLTPIYEKHGYPADQHAHTPLGSAPLSRVLEPPGSKLLMPLCLLQSGSTLVRDVLAWHGAHRRQEPAQQP